MANAEPEDALELESVLSGRYTVKAPISSGAMGAVYRAYDSETGEDVALKRLTDRRHSERFDIEARLLAHLNHPRVVRVRDYFRDESGKYLIMDLVEGTDLGFVLMERGRPGIPIDEAIEYVRQACEALQYVHDQQIVHRDVKPQNLIVSGDGVVLVDFGVATEFGDGEELGGTVGIGTPRFMAPEVFAGGHVSPRADVFGLAATLWTLLVGKPPVYADPKPLSKRVPEVSPELEQTIATGLEMLPERRVASVSAFAKALGSQLHSTGESLALSLETAAAPRTLIEGIVKTAAGVFEAAASSIALVDRTTGELVFQAAWGAGGGEILGVRLPPGTGIAGNVVETGEATAVADCRDDPRFAAQIAAGTGYVPYTMLVVPLQRDGQTIGTLSLLDRRDGGSYGASDMERAKLFAELAVTALDVEPEAFTSLGETVLGRGMRTQLG
jgi:putative methionine-R-sulfoxide reductase with GAF domain